MSRNDQASRILRIISLLEHSTDGMRVHDLVSTLNDQGFGCTRRTVYRDLDAIQGCGFPVENSDSGTDTGTWRISRLKNIGTKIVVTYEELLALFLARESLKNYQGSTFYASLETFFQKFETMLGDNSVALLRNFCSTVGLKSKSQWAGKVPKSFLDDIHGACSNGSKLEIEYIAASGDGAGKAVKRELGPECVYFADSGAYLVAHDFSKEDFRVFSISRIKAVKVLEDNYDSKIASPEQFFEGNFGLVGSGKLAKVDILLEGNMAPYVVERKWHKSQKVKKQGQQYLLSLEVKLNSELVSWILSLGADATVLAPEELAESVNKAALLIINKYKTKKAA